MKEKGVSTQALAERMGVSPQYVIEVANERKNVTLAVLMSFQSESTPWRNNLFVGETRKVAAK